MRLNSTDWYSHMSGLTKEYALIKSGSYKKLMKKYCENQKTQGIDNQTAASEKSALFEIKSCADALVKEANALTSKGKFNVFQKDDGSYDQEAITKEVSAFVKNYNALVDSSVKTENTAVLRKTLTMVSTTRAYQASLEKAGIKVNSDNTLSIDEEKLAKVSGNDLKRLFQGTNSYGSKIMKQAAAISSASAMVSIYTRDSSFTKGNMYSFNKYF